MRINPYALVLIVNFFLVIKTTNSNIKKYKKYEKTTNDSSVVLNDSTIFVR